MQGWETRMRNIASKKSLGIEPAAPFGGSKVALNGYFGFKEQRHMQVFWSGGKVLLWEPKTWHGKVIRSLGRPSDPSFTPSLSYGITTTSTVLLHPPISTYKTLTWLTQSFCFLIIVAGTWPLMTLTWCLVLAATANCRIWISKRQREFHCPYSCFMWPHSQLLVSH